MPHSSENNCIQIDCMEFVKRIFRVLVNAVTVALAAYLIPEPKLAVQDVVMIAIAAAAVLAFIDLIFPCIGCCYSEKCSVENSAKKEKL